MKRWWRRNLTRSIPRCWHGRGTTTSSLICSSITRVTSRCIPSFKTTSARGVRQSLRCGATPIHSSCPRAPRLSRVITPTRRFTFSTPAILRLKPMPERSQPRFANSWAASWRSTIDATRVLRFALGMVAALCLFSAAAELCAANLSATPPPAESLAIGGAAINVEIEAGDLDVSRTQVSEWVRRSACAVTEYYAGFPVRNVDVKIVPVDEGKGVMFGRTVVVDGTPVIRVGLSSFATDSSLADDWVMTHEMVHLAFPSVPEQ